MDICVLELAILTKSVRIWWGRQSWRQAGLLAGLSLAYRQAITGRNKTASSVAALLLGGADASLTQVCGGRNGAKSLSALRTRTAGQRQSTRRKTY